VQPFLLTIEKHQSSEDKYFHSEIMPTQTYIMNISPMVGKDYDKLKKLVGCRHSKLVLLSLQLMADISHYPP